MYIRVRIDIVCAYKTTSAYRRMFSRQCNLKASHISVSLSEFTFMESVALNTHVLFGVDIEVPMHYLVGIF